MSLPNLHNITQEKEEKSMLKLYYRSQIVVFDKNNHIINPKTSIGSLFDMLMMDLLKKGIHGTGKYGLGINLMNKCYKTWDPKNKKYTGLISISRIPTSNMTKWKELWTKNKNQFILCESSDEWFGQLQKDDTVLFYEPDKDEIHKKLGDIIEIDADTAYQIIESTNKAHCDAIDKLREYTSDPYEHERFVEYDTDYYSIETESGYCMIDNCLASTRYDENSTYWGTNLKFNNDGICTECTPPTEGKIILYDNELYFEPFETTTHQKYFQMFVTSSQYACQKIYSESLKFAEQRAYDIIRQVIEKRYEYNNAHPYDRLT